MSESDEGSPAQFPEADGGGGRSGRGPATHVPGETEPGGALPPYEGRREAGDVEEMELRASTGDMPAQGLSSPHPEDTPGGSSVSPGADVPRDPGTPQATEDDPGVQAGHVRGMPTGEDGGA